MAQSRKQDEQDPMAGPGAHDPGLTAEKLLREQPTLAPSSPTEASDAADLRAWPDSPDSVQPVGQAGPRVIARFEVISELGSGGFGTVYKAHDPELRRDVAIKVPHRHRVASPKDAEAYLAEARILAALDHVHIVPVYDVGRTADGLCYVVSKFIEGCDLAGQIHRSRPTTEQSAELVASVAEALHYAHRKGLVHRDIKPANILIDLAGKPYVVDFGLALKEEDFGKGSTYGGTPGYMSPEQARGEGHRVDGRSDIFSLGVVLYELLTGRRPFRGDTPLDVQIAIIEVEPRPPRQWDDTIPKELDRICLKALAKRATDRYPTAKDLADDLRHALTVTSSADHVAPSVVASSPPAAAAGVSPAATTPEAIAAVTPRTPSSDVHPIKIVPKGLRSFDAHDADFFLELLPGPRDRDGLPDTIRFWKTRIEETDADSTFSVGLIYGPSGCGKSSLVKAGLLPRLAKHVVKVYVEASAAETESRILNSLRKQCSELSPGLTLAEAVAALRRGQGLPAGYKVLVVLDQFEQWLHAQRDPQNSELVQALRQCDGGRVQCVFLVRDDFWMAATRFMRALEVRLLEGQNSTAVDLFDMRHARKVLAGFGRAFGTLPEGHDELTDEHQAFLDQSVAGLAQDGKVVCIRLALLAEMMKSRPWTPESLKAVGGAEGVGVAFLEETFTARTAPPEHRLHQQAARAVLAELLPEQGSDIKGHMHSHDELLAASGYTDRPRDFDDLLRILDPELRLVTPTEEEGSGFGVQGSGLGADTPQRTPEPSALTGPHPLPAGEHSPSLNPEPRTLNPSFYQLTHDYLVPSLRDWLTRKQRETRRGRAELCLAERTGAWSKARENRHLPDVWEYLSIRWFTSKKSWTVPQRELMGAAIKYHGLRSGGAVATTVMLILLLAVGGPLVALREVRLRQLTQDQKNESDRLRTETQWRLAQTFTERGIAAAEQADYGRALLWFAESIRASEGNSQNRDHQDRANRIRMANYAPFCPRLVRVLADTAQITFSPNGRRFLTLESDRKCRVWDLNPDVSKSTICCELNDVAKAWFSPDSRLMLAETPDGTVRAYDTATGKPAGPSLSGAIRDTNSVMSPTGEWIAASKGDSNPVQVQLHNVASGQPIGEPFVTDTLSSLVYSPDGRWIYGSANRAGTLWASSTGKPAVSLGHDAGEAYRAYFGPDGKCIITHKNDELRLWDLHSGQPIGHPIKQPADHTFSPDGRWLATANGQVVKLLNTETGAELVTLYHGDQVLRMLFSASSRHLVTSTQDRLVHVWDVPSGQPTGQPMQHPATIASLELTPDDRWIVTSTPGSLYIWELDSGELVARVRIHEAEGKLSPSGLHFALVTEGVIQLWELLAGHRIRHVDSEGPVITTAPITDAVVSRDGRMLVTSSWTGTAQVWDARSGQAIGAVLSHERPIVKLAISADGRLVATASWDHTVRLWHSSTGSAACAALRHRAPVTAVAFSDNGRWLVTAAGNEAQLWDMTGRAVGSSMIHRGGIYSVHFSSDSRALVTASSDNSARVWTAPDGTLIRSFGHEDQVVFAAFSPDNRKIVTSANGTASVWDIDSGKTLGNRIVHHAGIGFATFSPDGRLLATASRDNTARVWDAASGKPISKPLQHDDFVNWITFSPDGSQVLTASLDGTARLWQASTGDPLCPPLAHKQALNHAFFAGDPARVLTVDRTTIRSWHVGEPLLADGDTLSQWAESLVAAQLDPSGYTRNLSSGEWEGKAAVAPGALPGSDGLIYGRRRSLFCRSRSLDYAGAFKNDAAGIHAELATVLDTQRGAEMLAWRPPEPFQSASGSPAAHKDSPTLLNGAWHCPRLPDGDESVPAWANDQPAFDVVGFLNSRRPLGDSDTKFLLAMTTLKGETWYDCFRSASLRSKRGPTAIETAKEAVELIAEKLTDGQVPKDRELPELDEKLGHFNQFLDEIDQVTRDPKWVHVTGQTFESMLPAVQESRTILRILRVKVHRDVSRGRLNEAIDSCDIGLRLSLGLRRRGGAIQNLVSFAQDFVLCDAVSEILGSAALRVEHCDRLLELLRRAQTDDLDPMAEALKVEYIMLRNSGADFIPRLTEGSLTPAEFSAEWDMPALARMSVDALTRDFVVDTNRWYEIVAQLYSRPYTHDRAVALAAAIQEFGRSSNPIVREFVSQLLQMMRAAVRGDTRLNGYIALIAVQRWRSVHGEWPATLADGVGEAALTHVPTDLYSNQPLRYRVVDGQPVVYSVGSDQKDDGGIIDWNADQQPGDFLFRIRQLAANSRSDCAVFANPE